MYLEPSLRYKLFITGLLFVAGVLLASVAGISLIISIYSLKSIDDIIGSASIIVIGLVVMGFGVSTHRQVKKGKI